MLENKKILIGGAGVSGIGAAKLLGRAGYNATIYDGNEKLNTEDIRKQMPEGMELSFVLGDYEESLADRYDMLILSPGISVNSPLARSFYDRKKTVWGEIELASCFAKGRIAAITGTNGKTTTTALVGEIFKMAPIHHHFELSGWPETKVVSIFSIVTAVLCLIGMLAY